MAYGISVEVALCPSGVGFVVGFVGGGRERLSVSGFVADAGVINLRSCLESEWPKVSTFELATSPES